MSVEAAAAAAIAEADTILVAAGAGMGVDSGLPDFRGDDGFWRAYPPMKALGLSFVQMANPRWFREDPTLAWGFYGHRTALYRKTAPHDGFAILKRFADTKRGGAFVFTSNVDGAFQKAGFDDARVYECHGSLGFLQCMRDCGAGLFSSSSWEPDVDESTFRAREPLPKCPKCGALARPNVLMFGDGGWDSSRCDLQEAAFSSFIEQVRDDRARLVVVECGAGSAVPTVRMTSERLCRLAGARLVRINVREPEVPSGQIGIASGALTALRAIEAVLTPP
ncbi:MAG: NAD-dependent deacetylase [Polyangiaceae bacterium]|nr:NAD-dependent deacetylase [Polyangiaceae bacterium]